MPKTARLDGLSYGFELNFVERVSSPRRIMKLGIHPHLAGLSLSDTVSVLDNLGANRARSTVHNREQKADIEPRDGRTPDKITLDETVVKVNGKRFWLYAAVDSETNVILHVRPYLTRTNCHDEAVSSGVTGETFDRGRRILRRWSPVVAGWAPRIGDALQA